MRCGHPGRVGGTDIPRKSLQNPLIDRYQGGRAEALASTFSTSNTAASIGRRRDKVGYRIFERGHTETDKLCR